MDGTHFPNQPVKKPKIALISITQLADRCLHTLDTPRDVFTLVYVNLRDGSHVYSQFGIIPCKMPLTASFVSATALPNTRTHVKSWFVHQRITQSRSSVTTVAATRLAARWFAATATPDSQVSTPLKAQVWWSYSAPCRLSAECLNGFHRPKLRKRCKKWQPSPHMTW